MRAASGSAERAKRVGSDTGERGMGKGEWGHAFFGHGPRHLGRSFGARRSYSGGMKQLASLQAWICANELARSAYRLTLEKPLSRHFGLSDQIRARPYRFLPTWWKDMPSARRFNSSDV